MAMHYSDPTRASEAHALPNVETFYVSEVEARGNAMNDSEGEEPSPMTEAGWYWWPCFPGCLPDGEPIGPFATEAAAVADAQGEGES